MGLRHGERVPNGCSESRGRWGGMRVHCVAVTEQVGLASLCVRSVGRPRMPSLFHNIHKPMSVGQSAASTGHTRCLGMATAVVSMSAGVVSGRAGVGE